MKIASLVPSWTETLIECGADVVARTRFCLYPENRVRDIAAVGGTKQIDWEKLRGTGAEFLILDREENPKSFASESPIPYFASSIHSTADMEPELRRLAAAIATENSALAGNINQIADRWEKVIRRSADKNVLPAKWQELPGVLQWIKTPAEGLDSVPQSESQLIYVIWKNPWMSASPQTFIGSVLANFGFSALHKPEAKLYPEFDLASLDPDKTVLLLSSEPYPFGKKHADLEVELKKFPRAIVDGELYSWFGIRSLKFLESVIVCP